MNTNTPKFPKTNLPDSDHTARIQETDRSEETLTPGETSEFLETSNKTGKHSSVEKLAASRPEFGGHAKPVPGAFGDDPEHVVTGRNAAPGTNRFHCESCGRDFNTAQELAAHETECAAAKAATPRPVETRR